MYIKRSLFFEIYILLELEFLWKFALATLLTSKKTNVVEFLLKMY